MGIAARRWSLRTVAIFAVLLLLTLVTTATAFADASGQPSGITDEARDMHDLYIIVLVLAVVVFVAVEAALVFIIFRYRRRSADEPLPPQTHGNNLLEIVWTTIPIVIVMILFVFSFITLVDVEDEADPIDLTVEVQGFQFSWQFTYNLNDLGPGSNPDDDRKVVVTGTAAEEPTLVIPVNEPVEFALSSTDVIHSFYVRDFLYKLDVIPGRDNRFKVTAREIGTYDAQCAELCGLNHALMRFHVRVVSRADFDKFIAEQTAASPQAQAVQD